MRVTLSAIVLMLATGVAGAVPFDGHDIQATAYFPDLPPGATTVGGPVTETVGAGIEFTTGEFAPFFGPSFDFAGATITITHAASGHATATFNGYEFLDVDGTLPDFTGVSILSDNTGLFSGDPSRVSFDSERIFVNFESLSFVGFTNPEIVLGIEAVPEPGTFALMGLGCLAFAVVRRRRR